MMFPTLISVRNNEPAAPVTIADALEVVMVQVLAVLGHAVALQFPVPTDEIVADIASDVIIKTIIIGRMRIVKDCKNGFIEVRGKGIRFGFTAFQKDTRRNMLHGIIPYYKETAICFGFI
jgi:hypothetical protein